MKETFEQLEKLSGALQDVEYQFLILEPILLYGIVFGIIGFIASYFMKADKLQIAALVVIAASSFVFLPYISARSKAQPRIEKVYKIESPSRVKHFADNTWSWKENKWMYYAVAGLAIATILVGARRNRLGLTLSIATVLFGLIAAKNSAWMHYRDALAYHPNLKTNEAPVTEKLRAKPASTSGVFETPATASRSGSGRIEAAPAPPASTGRPPRSVTPLNGN
ncbi:MAG: hypothetical protein HKN23_17615 [Verrucomicrobiales bacterium]|nr:hypothetical protein [Verrucomicrobiales bacterium]